MSARLQSETTGNIHLDDLRPYLGACCFILSCYVSHFYYRIKILHVYQYVTSWSRKNFPTVLDALVNSQYYAQAVIFQFVSRVVIQYPVSCAFHLE